MQFLFLSSIPSTRIFSYIEFRKSQKGQIKEFILNLLESFPDGLSCREMSEITGIWVQSLTNPLLELERQGKIKIKGIRRSTVSNRMVQVYSLTNPKT
jgi:hypothetical protein